MSSQSSENNFLTRIDTAKARLSFSQNSSQNSVTRMLNDNDPIFEVPEVNDEETETVDNYVNTGADEHDPGQVRAQENVVIDSNKVLFTKTKQGKEMIVHQNYGYI